MNIIAQKLIGLKRRLVKLVRPANKEIFVILDGGLVQEIVNLPANINVTVLDYDIEGADQQDLQISPVDGELCVIHKW